MRTPVVAVIGSGTEPHLALAGPLGRLLAGLDVHLVNGGGEGVMEAVSRSFTAARRRTGACVAIVPCDETDPRALPPGYPHDAADIVVRTHLPSRGRGGALPTSRNHIIVLSADAVVALPGSSGTASEVQLALEYGRPVIVFCEDAAQAADLPAAARRVTTLGEVERFLRAALDDRAAVIAASWDANAGAWAEAVRSGALESRRVATDEAILEEVLASGAHRVLDAGCGEGWLARQLAAAGCDVVGIDGSAELIAHAARSGDGRYIVLSYDDFARDPRAAGTDFDAVVFNFSLLGRDIHTPLAAARRSVVPGGRLFVQTPHPFTADGRYEDGWREETFSTLPGTWTAMPWYFRTLSTWLRELHDAGWSINGCREPLHPRDGVPLSVIWHCTAPAARQP